jgi:hypothetical protein
MIGNFLSNIHRKNNFAKSNIKIKASVLLIEKLMITERKPPENITFREK